MARKIVDLDAVVGPEIIVRLNGVEYPLPPDLPVEAFLRLQEAEERGADLTERQAVEELYELVLDLFNERRADTDRLERLPLGMRQMILAVGEIYGGGDTPADEGTGAEAKPAQGPLRSTSRRSRPSRARGATLRSSSSGS